MKILSVIISCLILNACNEGSKPYFKHSLEKYEKVAGDCNNYDPAMSMVSNIIGERYKFQKCLNTNYSGGYKAERKGDTVEITFEKPSGASALYKIELDINTYPRYNFLTIDGNTIGIMPAGN